jgi:hypothetical protein
MKYLKKYQLFESIEDDIKSYLTDICLDLTDIGFEVTIDYINRPNVYTECEINTFVINIIYSPNQLQTTNFKLGDVKNTIYTILDYMNSEDYFITLTSGFLKKLNTDTGQILYNQRINIPKNLDEWDKDQQLSLIQFYFEKNI